VRRDRAWGLAAGGAVVVGFGLRLALGTGEVGDRSAVVMGVLLALGAWLTAMLLSTPRTALLATVAVVALVDLAALPPRFEPGYDDRQAVYRTDQPLSAEVPITPGVSRAPARPVLTLLAEPVFPASTDRPAFGLAGEVGGDTLSWDCAFRHGRQLLALQVPPGAINAETVHVSLHLTGSPSRDGDYLLAYASAPRGGLLLSLLDASDVAPGATACALR